MELIPKILLYASRFSVLIPLFFLFRERAVFAAKVQNTMWLLLVAAAISDLICYIMFRMRISNIVVGNSYIILQFCLLSYIYSVFLNNSRLIYATIITFTGFILINTVYIQPFSEFQNWPRALASILLIILSVSCYAQLLKKPPQDERQAALILWINMAVLFYFSLNLYLFFISNYIFKNESVEIATISWSFHNAFNIVKNILFATGIYYAGIMKVVKY